MRFRKLPRTTAFSFQIVTLTLLQHTPSIPILFEAFIFGNNKIIVFLLFPVSKAIPFFLFFIFPWKIALLSNKCKMVIVWLRNFCNYKFSNFFCLIHEIFCLICRVLFLLCKFCGRRKAFSFHSKNKDLYRN